MTSYKTMLVLCITSCFIFQGCQTETAEKQEVQLDVLGGVRYGGTFKFMSREKITNLFPLSSIDAYSNRVTSQIFEGLLKTDPSTMEVLPELAENYQISEDGLTYTFTIKDSIFFHDNPCFENGKGRIVNAHDFKFSLDLACSNHNLNKLNYLLIDRIEGAESYYLGDAKEVSGIKALDSRTLTIKLKTPFASFSKILTHAGLGVFPKESFEYYGSKITKNPVGTGAFMLSSISDEKIILEKNKNYWKVDDLGNKLPFLDSIQVTYSSSKSDELFAFRANKNDLVIGIPVEEIENILGSLEEAQEGLNPNHKIDSKASINVTYYGFNHKNGVFQDKRVRKAFNLAIDREEVIEKWLEGDGWAVKNGFVPKMVDYPAEKIKGYKLDIEEAKNLMLKAGYNKNNPFPVIDLYVNTSEGSFVHKLAQGVAFSLKQNIGVTTNIVLCSINERDDKIANGDAIFWRAGWVADYPDPENFLSLFYSGNENNRRTNSFGYLNDEFNTLYEEALNTTDEKRRMEILAKCDQIIIDDAVVLPIMTEDFITMVNLKIRRFVTDELEQIDFSTIFIKEINN